MENVSDGKIRENMVVFGCICKKLPSNFLMETHFTFKFILHFLSLEFSMNQTEGKCTMDFHIIPAIEVGV